MRSTKDELVSPSLRRRDGLVTRLRRISSDALRVVVLEPHGPSRRVLQLRLGALGYRCHGAADLPGALALVARVHPDIVIYDRDVGISDIGTALRSLAVVHNPRVALVSTTTRDHPASPMHGEPCLVKPIDFRQLQELLKRTQ